MLEVKITFNGQQIAVQAPDDPIVAMMLLANGMKVMSDNYEAVRQKKQAAVIDQGDGLIVQPGLAPVDKRIIEEAQSLINK